MDIGLISVFIFFSMLLLLALGLPMAFTLGGLAAVYGFFLWGPQSIHIIYANMNQITREVIMVAVPLFVFMAYMLERSGVAEEIFDTAYKWLGSIKGGLGVAVVFSCTIIAAMSGISTTGVLLMGIIALPAMLQRKYNQRLAMGVVMAGGALGPLIPPSLILIFYSSISGISIGKLFVGGIIPGLLLSSLFTIYILVLCHYKPNVGPALEKDKNISWEEKLNSLKGITIPILLVFSVLGSIFLGIATPTEAASVGALGTIFVAWSKHKLNKEILEESAIRTLKTVGSVMWIIFAAKCFANIYQGLGAYSFIRSIIIGWNVAPWVILLTMQAIWIFLGCLMDTLSILMITSPIFIPLAQSLGIDLLWLGILYVVNTETAYLTPPFGVNLIVMQGIVGRYNIKLGEVYRAVLPFVALQIIALLLAMLFPVLSTWLPSLL